METGKASNSLKFLVVIPHYNHLKTLRQVVKDCLSVWPQVLVVDDGSEDFSEEILKGFSASIIHYTPNKGKGNAILVGAKWAQEQGFTHIITIDADGQHYPQEIPHFIELGAQFPNSFIIGERQFSNKVPISSRFGRSFGNFWVRVQTGKSVRDIQSGYRCYPVAPLTALTVRSQRYTFEVEVIVRALWAGFEVKHIPIKVLYPKERISHFSQLKDNGRLTILNTFLTIRSMLPIAHYQYKMENGKLVRLSYSQVLKENLLTQGSVFRNAISAAWGIFCGSLGLPGIRQVFLFGGAGWWNFNRLVCISFEKFCIGPFIPALCIEVGYFLRYGQFLTEFNRTTLGSQILQRGWEWVLGSMVVAPVLAGAMFLLVGAIGWMLRKGIYESV